MLFYNDDTKIFMMIFSFQIRMSVYSYACVCVCSFWRDIALQYSEYSSPSHGSCILKSACKVKKSERVKIPFENLLGFSYRYFVSNMGAFPSLFLYAQDIVVDLHSRGRLNKKYSVGSHTVVAMLTPWEALENWDPLSGFMSPPEHKLISWNGCQGLFQLFLSQI